MPHKSSYCGKPYLCEVATASRRQFEMSKKLTGKALTDFEASAMSGKKSWTAYGRSKPAEENEQRLEANRTSFLRDSSCNCTLPPIPKL
jgi:hypothetical protein